MADLSKLSKEDLEKEKLQSEITNLRRQWMQTSVQYGGLVVAIVALSITLWTSSYDKRQAVIERDQARLDLKLVTTDLEKSRAELKQEQERVVAAKSELKEALDGLKLALEKTIQANSPAVQDWAKKAFSRDGIVEGAKDFIKSLSVPGIPPALRDHCVRGINKSVELYPDIRPDLMIYSKQVGVDSQVWTNPKYTTTEVESTEAALKLAEEAIRKRQREKK